MTTQQANALLTTPLGSLPPDVAAELITQLLTAARGLGLRVNDAIVPEMWADALADRCFAELKSALMAYANRGSAWLNIPGELLALMPDAGAADRAADEAAWATIERAVASARGHVAELAPHLCVRHYLAAMDCGTLAFDLRQAEHPLERARLRDRFLLCCSTPRNLSRAALAEPALPYRERLQIAAWSGRMEQAALVMRPIEE